MRLLPLVLLLLGCTEVLPEPTLATVHGENAERSPPPTDQLVILGPDELILDLPGVTDAPPEDGAGWGPYQQAGVVRIPLVEQALDQEGGSALASLLAGLKAKDPTVKVRAHAELSARALVDLKDRLHQAGLTEPRLAVVTPDGEAWLAVDLIGGANRALFLTANGLTPMAHRAGEPAYDPPAAPDLHARARALLAHYPTHGNHTALLLPEPEKHDIQRTLEALAAIDGPRMLMEPEERPHTRRLEAVMDPRRPKVSLDRIEISSMDAADAASHDRLLWTQVKLVNPGLMGAMDCYTAALEGQPTLTGELPVTLRLDREGTAAEAAGVGDETLHRCVEAAVTEAIKPNGKAELEIVAVLTLEAQREELASE